MHFFNGISKFGVNSFDFESKCNKHTKQDIERFKNKQQILFVIMLILFTGIMVLYIVSYIL
jgi:hypothetical protein